MKILITGMNGFIGGALCEYFGKTKHIVDGTNRSLCDLTDENRVEKMFRFNAYDVVIHTAANPLTDPTKVSSNTLIKDNIQATLNLAKRFRGKRFIYCSSATVYDKTYHYAGEYYATKPSNLYGATKNASEGIVAAFANLNDFSYVNARLCAVVGGGATHGAVKDIYQKCKNDPVIEVFGKWPGAVKPYIHISDVCKAFEILMNSINSGPYNVCNDQSITIQDIISTMNIQKKEIKWTGTTWDTMSELYMQNEKMTENFSWRPKLNSMEAIGKTLEEYLIQDDEYYDPYGGY